MLHSCEPYHGSSSCEPPPAMIRLLLFLIVPTEASGSSASTTVAPKAIPYNSSHLLISWHGVFINCKGNGTKGLVLRDQSKVTSENIIASEKVSYNLSDETALVQLNPCSKQSITVQMKFSEIFNKNHIPTYPLVVSLPIRYNSNLSRENAFGGFLDKKLCQQNNELVIPKELTSCLTKAKNGSVLRMEINDRNQTEELNLPIDNRNLDPCSDASLMSPIVWVVLVLGAALIMISIVIAVSKLKPAVAWAPPAPGQGAARQGGGEEGIHATDTDTYNRVSARNWDPNYIHIPLEARFTTSEDPSPPPPEEFVPERRETNLSR